MTADRRVPFEEWHEKNCPRTIVFGTATCFSWPDYAAGKAWDPLPWENMAYSESLQRRFAGRTCREVYESEVSRPAPAEECVDTTPRPPDDHGDMGALCGACGGRYGTHHGLSCSGPGGPSKFYPSGRHFGRVSGAAPAPRAEEPECASPGSCAEHQQPAPAPKPLMDAAHDRGIAESTKQADLMGRNWGTPVMSYKDPRNLITIGPGLVQDNLTLGCDRGCGNLAGRYAGKRCPWCNDGRAVFRLGGAR